MNGSGSTHSGNTKTWLIVAASLAGFALVAVLGWGFLIGWTVDTKPSDAHRGVTGEHLATHYDTPELREGTVEIVRTWYLDGSYDVSVDYEQGDLFLTSSLYSVERRASDAMSIYAAFLVAGPVMETMAEVELQDRDDLFAWGDNSSSKVILVDGEPGGHVIVARDGNVVFMVTLAGFYEEDPERLEALLRPMLDSAQRDG